MNDRRASSPARDRGFALLIVLWTMVLLALLAMRIAASGRTEARLASNLRDAAIAEAAADASIQESLFHLLATDGQRWEPSGRYRIALRDAVAEVDVENLAGRVNPNAVSPELLRALLMTLGVDSQRATALADAIADWRMPGRYARPHGAKMRQYRAAGRDYGPPGAPFQSVDELGAVLGMTPELLALLRPHLTLWWDDNPDPALADPVVLAALQATGDADFWREDDRPQALVVSLTAEATGPRGSRFTRRAVMAISATPRDSSWRILAWE
jgi:general secretion pathway protein K